MMSAWSLGTAVLFNTPPKLPYPEAIVLDQVPLSFSRLCPLVVALLGNLPCLVHWVYTWSWLHLPQHTLWQSGSAHLCTLCTDGSCHSCWGQLPHYYQYVWWQVVSQVVQFSQSIWVAIMLGLLPKKRP